MLKKSIKKILRAFANTYEKTLNPYVYTSNVSIADGWSIIVITDGKSPSMLTQLVSSAEQELYGTPYEIIIVGPKHLHLNLQKINFPIRHIKYREIKVPFIPGWITRKKNIGILASRYTKVVICHDYIHFNPGWKKGFDNFDNFFEVCTNIILDIDGERNTDWLTWNYPGIGQALIPYDKTCNEYQYLSGLYFVGKRDFLIENPQLEQFRWGEAEDIEWSKIVRTKTLFKINTQSTVQFSKPKWKLSKELLEASERLKKLL